MYGCVESSWSIVLAVGPGVGAIWNVTRIMRRRCLQYSAYEKWVKYSQQWTPMFGSDFPLLFVFFLRQNAIKRKHPFHTFHTIRTTRTFSLRSQVARQLALLTSASAMHFESPVPITGPTPRWLRRAGCPQGAKGEACCEWMERNNMKSTTRRTHSVGNEALCGIFSILTSVSLSATYFRSFQPLLTSPKAATVWNQWTTTTDSRLHRFRRLVMVGKPQLYTYNLFNLFVVKGLLEFICICLLTRTISTLSIPKFSLSTFQPVDLSSSRGCKSSSPQHLPSNWESLWYEVAFFSGSVHCFFVSALWTIGPWVDQVYWNAFGV